MANKWGGGLPPARSALYKALSLTNVLGIGGTVNAPGDSGDKANGGGGDGGGGDSGDGVVNGSSGGEGGGGGDGVGVEGA